MRALWAELALGWRRAVRGALLATLLAALALCLLALPGRDDAGLTRTGYGLFLAWGILLVAALWCGGTAYALDRERHRLTLAFTKPLRRWTLWWGRFLGTLAPFAAAVAALWLFAAWRPFPEGRAVLRPTNLPDLSAQAAAWLDDLRGQGRVPEGASENRLLRATREMLETRPAELRPGEAKTYLFPALSREGEVAFRLSGRPFLGARDALRLSVTVACAGKAWTFRPETLPEATLTVALPPGLARPGAPLTVTLLREDANDAGAILYRERADVALLGPGQPPPANLAAFCLAVLLTVAMAAALGTALGCAFSLPVTLFVGTLAFAAAAAATLSPETAVVDEVASVWARASTLISACVAWPFRGLAALDPLGRLMAGEAIGLGTMARLAAGAVLPWCAAWSLLAMLSPLTDESR